MRQWLLSGHSNVLQSAKVKKGKVVEMANTDASKVDSFLNSIKATIKNTGLSIVYTSLVLTAGFILFCLSGFGGTKALGWLTSLTLLVATITNLVLLPVLLITFKKPTKSDKFNQVT